MSDLTREITVKPAYDCIRVRPCVKGSDRCYPGSGGSHGVCSAVMYLTLRGPQAEVTLDIFTGWYLPDTPKRVQHVTDHPSGGAVNFHTAFPQFDGHDPYTRSDCKLWTTCYIDNGFLMADEGTALLVSGGTDAAWEWLEGHYQRLLSEAVTV